MSKDFRDIPKGQLVGLGRAHPGFRRIIKAKAAKSGVTSEYLLHQVLLRALGDPGPIEPSRAGLVTAEAS